MKILCMCRGGQTRSVALTFVLKKWHKSVAADSLACAWSRNSKETLRMLFEWADRIVLVQPHHAGQVPKEFHTKLVCLNIGRDRFGTPKNPELIALARKLINDWKLAGWAAGYGLSLKLYNQRETDTVTDYQKRLYGTNPSRN